jgi:hypothetical protein
MLPPAPVYTIDLTSAYHPQVGVQRAAGEVKDAGRVGADGR